MKDIILNEINENISVTQDLILQSIDSIENAKPNDLRCQIRE